MKIRYLAVGFPALALVSVAHAQTAVPINGVAPQICELTSPLDSSIVTLSDFVSTGGANIGAVVDSNIVTRPAALFCNVPFAAEVMDDDQQGLVNSTPIPASSSAAYRNTLDYTVALNIGSGRLTRNIRSGSNGPIPQAGVTGQTIPPTPAAGPEAVTLAYQIRATHNPGVLPVPGTYTTTNTFTIIPRP